jgi:hexosaminidase
LTASLDNQYYKQDDIAAIVDYARQRGIRVMPEFDMPGHAKGLQPLAGKYIDFCSDNNNEIYGDPQHKSLESLQNLMAEMAALFPEPLFDIGCDETKELGDCTIEDIKNLEEELFNFIENDIEKTPVAYEEALFESKSSGRSVVIQAWESYRASDVVKKGNKAIEGNKFHFYLSLHPLVSLSAVWTDIAVNMTDDERRLLLGGEISFWTNDYCPSFQCGKNTRSHPQPPAYWMSDPGHDNVFSQSVGGMIWPRGIAAAGSFWNFNESLVTNSEEFLIKYQTQNQRLIDRGVISCPVHCTCDTLTKCGQPYPRNLDDVELQ